MIQVEIVDLPDQWREGATFAACRLRVIAEDGKHTDVVLGPSSLGRLARAVSDALAELAKSRPSIAHRPPLDRRRDLEHPRTPRRTP